MNSLTHALRLRRNILHKLEYRLQKYNRPHGRDCSSVTMALHSFRLKINLSLTAEVVVLKRCDLNFLKYSHTFTLKH